MMRTRIPHKMIQINQRIKSVSLSSLLVQSPFWAEFTLGSFLGAVILMVFLRVSAKYLEGIISLAGMLKHKKEGAWVSNDLGEKMQIETSTIFTPVLFGSIMATFMIFSQGTDDLAWALKRSLPVLFYVGLAFVLAIQAVQYKRGLTLAGSSWRVVGLIPVVLSSAIYTVGFLIGPIGLLMFLLTSAKKESLVPLYLFQKA